MTTEFPARRYIGLGAIGTVNVGKHGTMELAVATNGRLAYRFVIAAPSGQWTDYEDQCNDPDGGGARAARQAVSAFLATRNPEN